MEKAKLRRLLSKYVKTENPVPPLDPELLGEMLEYWAAEKDHELSNQLLRDLVHEYASSMTKLIDLHRLKDRFLRIAAHDVSSPLTAVRGLSDVLLTESPGPLTKEQKEYLTIISTTSNGILGLVNDLLDISVIESGRLQLRMVRGSLEKLIRERLSMCKIFAEGKRIILHVKFAELPNLPFDSNKIGQVVDNLLSNAIKFSPFDANISVVLEREGATAKVSVHDEGPGIPEEDQVKIFHEFQKLKIRPTGGEKSTGLGLAIAKRIVEAHHGTLKVESRPGFGSTFSFALPLEKENEQ